MSTAETLTSKSYRIEINNEEIIWDVDAITTAISLGLFGSPLTFAMEDAPPNYSNPNNFSRLRVEAIKNDIARLAMPAIAIGAPSMRPGLMAILCFCDGNHRLIARYELGCKTFSAWIVPWPTERLYRIDCGVIMNEY